MNIKYKIKKGKHYPQQIASYLPRFYRNFLGKYEVTIKFNSIPQDMNFFNKLIGVYSPKLPNPLSPRMDSCRIGWRYEALSDKFEICFFTEKNKEFTFSHRVLASYDKDKMELKFNIELGESFLFCKVNEGVVPGSTLKPDRLCMLIKPEVLENKLLLLADAYFGGDPTADQDYEIILNKI